MGGRRHRLRVRIGSRDRCGLDTVAALLGFGTVKPRGDVHWLDLTPAQSEEFLLAVLRHLRVKRRQAELGIESRQLRRQARRPGMPLGGATMGRLAELAGEMARLNAGGPAREEKIEPAK